MDVVLKGLKLIMDILIMNHICVLVLLLMVDSTLQAHHEDMWEALSGKSFKN